MNIDVTAEYDAEHIGSGQFGPHRITDVASNREFRYTILLRLCANRSGMSLAAPIQRHPRCVIAKQRVSGTITMTRNGVVRQIVQSPYVVTNTPFVEDLEYHIAGGLR